jgi:hypothetical protein
MMFAYLEIRISSKFSQQRGVKDNRHDTTEASENYGGTKEIYFASLTVECSTQHKGVSYQPQFPYLPSFLYRFVVYLMALSAHQTAQDT